MAFKIKIKINWCAATVGAGSSLPVFQPGKESFPWDGVSVSGLSRCLVPSRMLWLSRNIEIKHCAYHVYVPLAHV